MADTKRDRQRKPMVASLSVTFKRATDVTEDIAEAKQEHRKNLKSLVDTYMNDVQTGKAEGIRNAKELVEVIKADLLLMGEATDITKDGNSPVDEMRIQRMAQELDENDPMVQAMVDGIFNALNGANDEYGDGSGIPVDYEGEQGHTTTATMQGDYVDTTQDPMVLGTKGEVIASRVEQE